MSTINYSLKNKGVRLISSEEARVFDSKTNRKTKLNPKYKFVGKVEMSMPNMIVSPSDKTKPKYRGCVCELNSQAKSQIINHFYDDKGKRNKKTVAYFVLPKKK